MDISLIDKIKYSLQFNGNMVHNIFLGIVLAIVITFLSFLTLGIVRSIIKKRQGIDNNIKKRKFSKVLLAAIWPVLFPLGLFLIIDINLSGVSDASIVSNSLVYEVDGKYEAVYMIDRFDADSSDRHGVTGSSSFYLTVVELENGEPLFSKKIVPENSSVLDKPKVLCVSEKNIFAYTGTSIFIVDKASGELVKEIDRVDATDTVSLANNMCKYDSTLNKIVLMGANGIIYSLDVNNFTLIPENIVNADSYFEEYPFGIAYSRGVTLDTISENNYNMFLTDGDIQNLRVGSDLTMSAYGERRFIYNGNLDNLDTLTKLNPEVFINGAFLPQNTYLPGYNYESVGTSNPLFSNYVNIAVKGESKAAPFKTVDNKYLIVHRATIDPTANVLLSYVDLESKITLWTIDLAGYNIVSYNVVDDNHIVINFDDYELYISLTDGSAVGHYFKYNNSFNLEAKK